MAQIEEICAMCHELVSIKTKYKDNILFYIQNWDVW